MYACGFLHRRTQDRIQNGRGAVDRPRRRSGGSDYRNDPEMSLGRIELQYRHAAAGLRRTSRFAMVRIGKSALKTTKIKVCSRFSMEIR